MVVGLWWPPAANLRNEKGTLMSHTPSTTESYLLEPIAPTISGLTRALKWVGLPTQEVMSLVLMHEVRHYNFYALIPKAGCDKSRCVLATCGIKDSEGKRQLYLEVYVEPGIHMYHAYNFDPVWLPV